MTDVAKQAGVSQSSVSLVLNQIEGARISDATRQRVLQAAREVGYELPGQRRLEKADRQLIAFVSDDLTAGHPSVIHLKGIREVAWEGGFLVAAYVTGGDPEIEAAILSTIDRDAATVGLVYAAHAPSRVNPPLPARSKPTVLVNCQSHDPDLVSVRPADVSGGFVATTYLTDLGHRRIAMIGADSASEVARDRLKGYRQALTSADLPYCPELVRDGTWTEVDGYRHSHDLLRLPRRPTAVVCAHDMMAIGAIAAARDLGLGVPDDVSIVGFENQDCGRFAVPPLTTVAQAHHEVGRQAAEALLEQAVHRKAPRARTIKIDGELIIRGSTGPSSVGAVTSD